MRESEIEFRIDNLLVRIHFIIVMIRWTSLAPWFRVEGLGTKPADHSLNASCWQTAWPMTVTITLLYWYPQPYTLNPTSSVVLCAVLCCAVLCCGVPYCVVG